MSVVDELATDFANVCSSDVCKGVSPYTSSVIMNDLKLPDNYSEMSSEDVEYITGEWSIFGWNLQTSDLIGRYYNGDRTGQNWLELKGYMYLGQEPGAQFRQALLQALLQDR